jgi:ABC-type uncharacterized transport system substrate-binding protein
MRFSTIPIVMVAINYDPVALGYIDSIARPGANVTGLFFQHLELLTKRFGLFREMLPSFSRIAVLSDSLTADQLNAVDLANRSAGLELQSLPLQNPPYDFENAFHAAMQSRAEAILVLESPLIFRGRAHIAQLGIKNRLPTSFAFREYVEVGGTRFLRCELLHHVPARRRVRRQNSSRLETGRSSGGAVHQIRTSHQPKDRQNDRPRSAPNAARARRRCD